MSAKGFLYDNIVYYVQDSLISKKIMKIF